MRVYVLHLKGPAAVSRAFERLMASSRIDSCLVEPEHDRVRFRAPRKQAPVTLRGVSIKVTKILIGKFELSTFLQVIEKFQSSFDDKVVPRHERSRRTGCKQGIAITLDGNDIQTQRSTQPTFVEQFSIER